MNPKEAFHNCRTFAEFIASDDELFVFRRFNRLNARNLLYLQSEMIWLEAQLQEMDDEETSNATMDVKLAAKCWETLSSKAEEFPREAARMELILKIRKVAKEYSMYTNLQGIPSGELMSSGADEALTLQNQLLKIRQPKERVWKVFHDWFMESKPFVGHSRNMVLQKDDFVALKASTESDRLSETLEYWTGVLAASKQRDTKQKDGTVYYSDKGVRYAIVLVGITAATLSLEAPIVALHFAGNDNLRFGLIAIFSIIFAAAISFLSNVRLVELFGASAAYAAVLVVFLANDLNSTSGNHN